MDIRPYQSEAIAAVEQQWESGNRRSLLVLPTGTGKTIVFCKLIQREVQKWHRCLILAHRGELLDQAADKLKRVTGLPSGLEKASSSALGTDHRVVVGSVQSLQQDNRLAKFPPDYFSTIVVDEAHHALSNGYQKVLQHFPEARVLGVTATPDRGDYRNLGEYFDSLAYEYSLPQAIKDKYLCPIVAQTIPIQLDLRSVTLSNGDYKASDLDNALGPYLERIATEMEAACKDRKTVVFLPLVATSQRFRDILNAHGFRAAEVNGNSKDRQEVLDAFAAGEYNVLCNSMLLTEGWDCPSVDCIVVLRATKVRSLYCQMVGRGTRLSPGKENLLLLDFLWQSRRHELCRPAHLICETDEIAQVMTDNLAKGGPMDIEQAAKTASEDVIQQREEALAKQLREMRNKKGSTVDPLQYAVSINAADLIEYTPAFGWESRQPTSKQIDALINYGIDASDVTTAGLAAKLLDHLQNRKKASLATPKQIRLLERKGFEKVGEWSFHEAGEMISRISANGWRVPSGVDPATYHPSGDYQTTMNFEV